MNQAIGTAPIIVNSVMSDEQDAMIALGKRMHRRMRTMNIAENSKMLKTNMIVERTPRPWNSTTVSEIPLQM